MPFLRRLLACDGTVLHDMRPAPAMISTERMWILCLRENSHALWPIFRKETNLGLAHLYQIAHPQLRHANDRSAVDRYRPCLWQR